MTTSRRSFLMLAAGSVVAAGLPLPALGAPKKPAPMKLLIFGGTGFIGPHLVQYAVSRGHTVSIFNRGKSHPEMFPNVERLIGDRDPNKGEGLKALEGRKFDAVIDDTGYYPRMVGASAQILAPNVRHYVYVSSVSAYADNRKANEAEDAPLATLKDPNVETMGEGYANYGGLKAACEQAVQKTLPDRSAIVRPGFIVGPGDHTDRFTYWPLRIERGGEVMAPGSPSDPLQVIDVRDLAEWMIHLVETNTTGVFNAVGPAKTLTWGEMLEASMNVTGKKPKLTWVSGEFIEKVPEQVDLPLAVPPGPESTGFHTRSNARAIKAGLKFRKIEPTIRDTLAWFHQLPAERQAKLHAGLPPETEAVLLQKWNTGSWKEPAKEEAKPAAPSEPASR